jgi:hypothetical protein
LVIRRLAMKPFLRRPSKRLLQMLPPVKLANWSRTLSWPKRGRLSISLFATASAVLSPLAMHRRREARMSRCANELRAAKTLPITQENRARMIGVQRNAISIVARPLQQADIVSNGQPRANRDQRPGRAAAVGVRASSRVRARRETVIGNYAAKDAEAGLANPGITMCTVADIRSG